MSLLKLSIIPIAGALARNHLVSIFNIEHWQHLNFCNPNTSLSFPLHSPHTHTHSLAPLQWAG